MNRPIKITIVSLAGALLICASLGVFMLSRAANGVRIEYSQLPAPERKIATMLDGVYADMVTHKSYRLRRGGYYVFMNFDTNKANTLGEKINLSGMIARQRRFKLSDNQFKVEELERRRALELEPR